jgi:hypothetical protein
MPTGIVAVTWFVRPLITDTVPTKVLATCESAGLGVHIPGQTTGRRAGTRPYCCSGPVAQALVTDHS